MQKKNVIFFNIKFPVTRCSKDGDSDYQWNPSGIVPPFGFCPPLRLRICIILITRVILFYSDFNASLIHFLCFGSIIAAQAPPKITKNVIGEQKMNYSV